MGSQLIRSKRNHGDRKSPIPGVWDPFQDEEQAGIKSNNPHLTGGEIYIYVQLS